MPLYEQEKVSLEELHKLAQEPVYTEKSSKLYKQIDTLHASGRNSYDMTAPKELIALSGKVTQHQCFTSSMKTVT